MSLTFAIFCVIAGLATVKSNAFQICCPPHWILYKNGSTEYKCAENKSQLEYTLQSLGAIDAPAGYGIPQSSEDTRQAQFPDCTRPNYNNISLSSESPMKLANSSCLAIIDQHLVAISCDPINDEILESVGFINKCCPHGYAYSSETQKCTERQPDFEIYSSILRNTTVFVDNSFECPTDRVLVEYIINADIVEYSENQLIWNDKSKRLSRSDFCIEALDDNVKHKGTLKYGESNGQQFLIRACEPLLICKSLPCIRRCCADGEMYAKGNATTYCKRDESDIRFHSFSSLDISGNFSRPAEFGILRGLDCPKFRLDPDSFSDESHVLSPTDGSLLISSTLKMYTNNQYCIEKIRNSTFVDQKLYTFLCFDSKVVSNDKIRFRMYPVGLLISCCFYAITLMVYVSISKLRNLPGKILICLVSSLFFAYLGIALGQLMPTSNDDVCFISGFFVYFCLMAAFSWMNVTCFDIWQTFGSTRSKGIQRSRHDRRFIWYSLYGWGLPTLLTTITISLTKSDVLADSIRPNFGHGRCWFTYDTIGFASLLFFSGPVGLIFLINLVLFLLTLRYCNKVKREIYRMQSSNCEKPALRSRFFIDRTRFAMNSKLCIVMGITWLLEIASIMFYDHKKTFFWTISDSFNVLLGVFVFFIFVFKRRIWREITLKLGFQSAADRQRNANATCVTQSTCATQNISMAKLSRADGNATLLKKYSNVPASPLML